jgi:plastocyanin
MRLILLAAAATTALSVSAFAADHAVAIKGFKFEPAQITIAKGDTVTFTNEDAAPHTATSLTAGVFDTGRLAKGESKTISFADAGAFEFKCKFHPTMKGTVTAN